MKGECDQFMMHLPRTQVGKGMPGVDRDLLADYVREKIEKENLSLRKAAGVINVSPATLSRLLKGSDSDYEPDTATLASIGEWLELNVSEFEQGKRPKRDTSNMTDVAMHLHALPNISKEDAEEMIAVVKALYDSKRKRASQ
jgi:transcriptional regulator with XRE-family HTH domain